MPLARFLVALSIPQVGTITAQDIAKEFRTLKAVINLTASQAALVPGVGEIVAEEISSFFALPQTKQLLKKYQQAGIKVKNARSGGKLSGKTFLFTGSLPDMSRDEAKAKVQALGGKVASTAATGVDYVVIGEDPGSKAKKAEQLGLTTISPKQFFTLTSHK